MLSLVERFCAVYGLVAAVFISGALAGTMDKKANTVLITGANRGIGLELARQFKAGGYDVIGTARNPKTADNLQSLDVRVEQLDVADTASVKALAARLKGTAIDILINNAGIAGHGASTFAEHDFDAIDRTFQVNSLGPMRVTQALLENLRQGREKKILNMSSMMGSIEMNQGGAYGYRASKAALNSFNKTMSVELGNEGFICVVLHPGWVRTGIGGNSAPLSTEESVTGLIRVIEDLDANSNGRFIDYTGKELPW
jgi:NAD(P)-dependent dehydrogenase (short-subunit alcohol dehydrogenase family)